MAFGERLLTVDIHANDLVPAIMLALQEGKMSVFRTFSLDSACAPLNTPCPHHGTTSCSCGLEILMFANEEGTFHSLIIHGCDGESELSILDANSHLVEEVRRIIFEGIERMGMWGSDRSRSSVPIAMSTETDLLGPRPLA